MASQAATLYAHPTGSGSQATTGCTFESPCTLTQAKSDADPGDTVLLKDGTYNGCFKTVRGGTSNTNRITFKALNRHAAIVRYPGSGCHSHFHVDHSWITVSGLNINATSSGGAHAFDASKISDGTDKHSAIQGVLFEDNYVHDAGHLLIWTGNSNGASIEVRNNTFDMSGHDDSQGEANYWGSFGTQNPAIVNSHHNIFSRYKANAIDFKGEYRDGYAHDNFFMDHRLHSCSCGSSLCTANNGGCNNNDTGDGTFVIGVGAGDQADSTTNNRVIDNVVWRPRSKIIFAFVDPVQIRANGNVIVDWVSSPETSGPQLNGGASMFASSTTHSNIHCPSEGMSQGTQTNGGNPANQVNQPIAECDDRIDEIVGLPTIASCNIGDLNDNTVTVEFSTAKNGPVSSVEIPLDVTYDNVNQTGESTTHAGNSNQANVAVTTAPSSDAVAVRVVASAGSIRNSAFIGAKDCDNGNDFGNTNYIRTGGFCGENRAAITTLCTNTITGGGPPPLAEALDQAVWRFYAMNNAEGVGDMAPENTDITSRKGGELRWRVGVRGGGNDSPSRSYALAGRVCKPGPICGPWLEVSDDPNVGVIFLDDQVQDDGTATTNQLSLGGKTFLAGLFMDVPAPIPATAILSTQQIEWEFGLQIPAESAAVAVGDFIQLRIQHDTGTGLSAYIYPAITILEATAATYSGSITGSIK